MSPDNRFVKFPTRFLDFIRTARISIRQVKMITVVVRHCHGFHQPERRFDLTDLRHWLGGDRRKIFRTAEQLVQRGVFLLSSDKSDGRKYQIQNDSEKWSRLWKSRPVEKPVDNPVDNSKIVEQLRLLGESLSSLRKDSVITSRSDQCQLSTAPADEEGAVKPASEQENSPEPRPKLTDMVDWLKKDLKKRESHQNFLEQNERKRKIAVFKEMALSRLWTDSELGELARTRSAEQLELIWTRRKTG